MVLNPHWRQGGPGPSSNWSVTGSDPGAPLTPTKARWDINTPNMRHYEYRDWVLIVEVLAINYSYRQWVFHGFPRELGPPIDTIQRSTVA